MKLNLIYKHKIFFKSMLFLLVLMQASFFYINCFAQITIPWSSSLDVTFGHGINTNGQPLSIGNTSFSYTTNTNPVAGQYRVIKTDGGGHFYRIAYPTLNDSGYMMMASFDAQTTPIVLFSDTVKNLCSNNQYLFWAYMQNLKNGCNPNCDFVVETLSGQLIESFNTGAIGGVGDKAAVYPSYPDTLFPLPPAPRPAVQFPRVYYGGIFALPLGITDVVVKIKVNGTGSLCSLYQLVIDNILITPIGPNVVVTIPNKPGLDQWVQTGCFTGNHPIILDATIDTGYMFFGTNQFVNYKYTNPSYQWQQSLDDGFTWTDIAGETNAHFAHNFTIPNTFYIRVRVQESSNINNTNCSVVSNIMQAQVDNFPKNVSFTSNSPVCRDSDLIFQLDGGASYVTTGSNNFYDNSAHPHIYSPPLSDTGWYYTQISTFGGCTVADSLFAKIVGPNLIVSGNQSICYGNTVQLLATGGNNYAWSPSIGLSNPNIANPIASPIVTTRYQVKTFDQQGCSAHDFITISLKDSILKAIISGSYFACPNDRIIFKDSSIGKITSWSWNFGNSEISNIPNPPSQTYINHNNITYPVKLLILDSFGCYDSTTFYFKAVNNCNINVPNAFTPNNDGINDYLYPLNAYKATNLKFIVYNRLGQKVFETNNWLQKWDGTYKELPQPAGAYIWILQYDEENNIKQFFKGTTILIR